VSQTTNISVLWSLAGITRQPLEPGTRHPVAREREYYCADESKMEALATFGGFTMSVTQNILFSLLFDDHI